MASTKQPYELPRDRDESARLDNQHTLYKENLGYLLHPKIASSIPPDARVADIGTGTGAWMLDLASSPAGYTFEGLDISNAQFPAKPPSNCSFQTLNVLEPIPEELKGRYDVVHARLLVCGLTGDDWTTMARHALELLKPGGWIQWCESDFDDIEVLQNEPGVSREASLRFAEYNIAGLRKVGKFQEPARKLLSRVQAAGFDNCGQDVVSSDRVPSWRDTGSEIVNGAFLGIGKSIAQSSGDTRALQELEALYAESREEAVGGKIYYRWSIHNVIGQRPSTT